ncbi:MAG: Helix-turn-helix domain protein, partial [uncultured Blastococcus sp.]
ERGARRRRRLQPDRAAAGRAGGDPAAARRRPRCPLPDGRLSGARRVQPEPAPGAADRGVLRAARGDHLLHRALPPDQRPAPDRRSGRRRTAAGTDRL